MTQPNPFQGAAQPVDEFELMRRRLRQRGAVRGEETQRQLSRQFAALGNLPSGSALKQQQLARQQQAQQTSADIQDVNILQAQTQRAERESAAQRALQRFGIETQAQTAREALAGQRDIAGLQAATTRAGFQSQQDIARLQAESQFRVAQLGANTDLEKARLQGANQIELAQIQTESNQRIAQLEQQGLDRRLAEQIGANRELFDIEIGLKERGLSLQEELQKFSIDQGKQEMALNKAATVLNALDPLSALGFSGDEVGNMIEALGLPFGDQILEQYNQRAQRIAAEPPAPRKPTNEEKFTKALGEAPANLSRAVNNVLEDWFPGSDTRRAIQGLGFATSFLG